MPRSSILDMQEKPSLSAGPSHPNPAQGLRNNQRNKLSDESHRGSASIIVNLIRANSQHVGFLEIVSFSLPRFLFASRLQQSLINCGLKLFRRFSGNKSSPSEQGVLQRRHSPEWGGEKCPPGQGCVFVRKHLPCARPVPRPGADLHPPRVLELSTPVPSPFQGLSSLPLANGRYKASAAESRSARGIQVNFPWELLSLLAPLLLSEGHEKRLP